MQNMTNLLQLLTKANMQMPGVFTLDPKVLELYQMPAIAAAQQQSAQRGFAGTLGIFAPQPTALAPTGSLSASSTTVADGRKVVALQ